MPPKFSSGCQGKRFIEFWFKEVPLYIYSSNSFFNIFVTLHTYSAWSINLILTMWVFEECMFVKDLNFCLSYNHYKELSFFIMSCQPQVSARTSETLAHIHLVKCRGLTFSIYTQNIPLPYMPLVNSSCDKQIIKENIIILLKILDCAKILWPKLN